ncbi:hypothetical protein SAMN06295945_0022 [Polynucleobacter meluiroseus]|uniref:Uncharacterized protein n=1 Tax=Polynucleobacter meluiroseus TaxID=1938814 RepID=A0A240DZQ0_9BURK|nr:hypothetical protein [Polynucleobacter meluiroseus]SNX27706.1 hypothetical protein SAMN06295945_0022 [Polynucleobacter meluiroseus]
MLIRSKTITLAICFFLIAFKVMASGIFIQAALERASSAGTPVISMIAPEGSSANQSNDAKHHQVSSLNLMSHVTANLCNANTTLLILQLWSIPSAISKSSVFKQNFPDSAFKPPKVMA